MIIALWILNVLVTIAFLGAGLSKLLRDRAAIIAGGMGWAEDFSGAATKAIGAVEVLGALGVILPFLTGIAPILSPIAATALAAVMIAAVVVHARRRENPAPAVVLAILSAVTAVLGFLAL